MQLGECTVLLVARYRSPADGRCLAGASELRRSATRVLVPCSPVVSKNGATSCHCDLKQSFEKKNNFISTSYQL